MIRVLTSADEPIDGYAYVVETLSDKKQRLQQKDIVAGNIIHDFDLRAFPCKVIVMPKDGHWSREVDLVDRLSPIRVEAMSGIARTWWRDLLVPHPQSSSRENTIRVGVIDIGFTPRGGTVHADVSDLEGEKVTKYGAESTHGHRVAAIIGSRSSDEGLGLACEAELLVVDVGMVDENNMRVWSYPEMVQAISYLVEQGVDLINLSGGVPFGMFPENAFRPLEVAIEDACNNGVLCIAAVGNQKGRRPAYPALYEGVVGVAALGLVGLSNERSIVASAQAEAKAKAGATGLLGGNGSKLFHYPESCQGEGVDVIAPGVGIVLGFEDGDILDYSGTSYACPMVTGVLANRLAALPVYRSLHGREKWNFAKSELFKLCKPISGMDVRRQGRGVPIISG